MFRDVEAKWEDVLWINKYRFCKWAFFFPLLCLSFFFSLLLLSFFFLPVENKENEIGVEVKPYKLRCGPLCHWLRPVALSPAGSENVPSTLAGSDQL